MVGCVTLRRERCIAEDVLMSQDFTNLNTGMGNQSGLPNAEALYQPKQTSALDSKVQETSLHSKDSIEKASAVVASLYLPPLSNPLLIPPDANNIIAISQLAMDKICLNILDSWSQSLKKIAEEKREADRRKELNPLLQDLNMAGGLVLAVATIFIRAIFGTQIAQALQKNPGLTDEKVIAHKFATQIAQWSLDGVLGGYLMTIVDKLPSATSMNEGEKKVLAQQMQAMLLAAALGGIYKAKYEWITSKEFMDVLSDPFSLKDSNMAMLAMLLVNTLNELPEEAKLRMMKTLNIYMDSNPDLPSLFDLGHTTGVQLSILKATRL